MIKTNNADFEYYILGCTMKLDKELNTKIFETLSVNDFTSSLTRKIFDVGNKLFISNKPIDIVNMTSQYLEIHKESEYGNVLDMLTKLESRVETTAHADYYIKNLKELTYRRNIIKSSKKIIEMSENEHFDNIEIMRDKILSQLDLKIDTSQADDYELFNKLNLTMQKIEDDYQNGNQIAPTGYKWLDTYAGGLLNGLTYIGARPSIGKTSFVVNVLNNLTLNNKKYAFFNLEMSSHDVLTKNLSITGKISNSNLRQAWNLQDKDWETLARSYGALLKNTRGSYLVDDKYTIEEIENLSRQFNKKTNLEVVVIDYLQLISSTSFFNNRYALITEVSRRLKLLQKELNIPIWVLAQMSRDSAGNVPALHQLKESGAIEQDADRVILLHDPDAQKEHNSVADLWLMIAKNRYGARDIMGYLKYYKNTQLMCQSQT